MWARGPLDENERGGIKEHARWIESYDPWGEHTVEMLGEAGCSADEIADLRKRGEVYTARWPGCNGC